MQKGHHPKQKLLPATRRGASGKLLCRIDELFLYVTPPFIGGSGEGWVFSADVLKNANQFFYRTTLQGFEYFFYLLG
jgi:hypothetical protein